LTTSVAIDSATEGIHLFCPRQPYALVDDGTQHIPCRAVAHGGDIDVDCDSEAAGTLIVHENNWEGWWARRDGEPIDLEAKVWLSTAAPTGRHHYEFRYRPVDVPIGLIVSAIGLVLVITLLSGASRHRR
jgi:hypothetical protein